MRLFNRFASSSALVLAVLVGCNLHSGSGLDPNELVEGGGGGNLGDDGGMNTGSSGGGSGGGSGGSSPGIDAGTGSSSGTGSPNCASMGPSGCISCCEKAFPYGQSYQVSVNTCACSGAGNCAAECAGELCADQPFASPGDACQQCVVGQSCYSQIQQNCSSNTSCQQYQACAGGCPYSGSSSGGGSGSSSGGGDVPDAGSPQDASANCASNPSMCIQCCGNQDPSGYQVFLTDVTQCLCGVTGPCASACANELCAGKGFSSQNDPCQVCVQQNTSMGTTCYSQVKQECTSNATCAPFGACYLGCPPGSQ